MLNYTDIAFLPKDIRFSLLMTHDPKINRNVWEQSDINDLAHWTFHSSLLDQTIDKIAANIAARLRTRTIKKQIAFLKKHNYLSPNNLLLAAKIIRGLMKAPVKNFAIIRKLEESYFATKEQKILLWKNVFDGLPKNRLEKRYALYQVCELINSNYWTVALGRDTTKGQRKTFQKLRIAA